MIKHPLPPRSLARFCRTSALVTMLAPFAAQAQEAPQDDFHGRNPDEIVVTATGLEQLDVLAGTSVLDGLELQRNSDGQIGEVLAKLPGVSATSFSPGASRPVLRGFQGERVRVLTDGIGAIDASNTSADHAVAIDPLTSARIEVLRGPAVLLYGSQAIGGAVNVISKRIPLKMPEEPVHLDMAAGINSAANLREGGASLDVPLGTSIAVHLDGSWRKTDDLDIAGKLLSPGLRADLLAEAVAQPESAAQLRKTANEGGTLTNSATESWSLAGGATLFSGESNLGFSLAYFDTSYGVPTRPVTDAAAIAAGSAEEESVSIAMHQLRADMRGKLDLGGGPFSELQLRAGYSDYTHTEFEGGAAGTVFDVTGFEGRAELVQAEQGDWRGSLGAQFTWREFAANGEEAYIAANKTRQFALFTLQEVGLGPLDLELGGRYENSRVEAAELGLTRQFDTWSGALSVAHETAGGLRFGLSGSRAQRAPSAEELFVNGAHIATQQFEIGDTELSSETAWGLEAYMRGHIGPATVSLSAYKSWFSDYIVLEATGTEEDGLPAYRYAQTGARYQGLEGEVSLPFLKRDGLTLLADIRGDYIKASRKDGRPLPRIPPLSLLGALEAQSDHWDGRVEVQWFDKQNRIAAFETATDGFTYVNASLAWHPLRGTSNVTILAQVDNIFDVSGRRHASFTKDFVPLGGRNAKLSARFSF